MKKKEIHNLTVSREEVRRNLEENISKKDEETREVVKKLTSRNKKLKQKDFQLKRFSAKLARLRKKLDEYSIAEREKEEAISNLEKINEIQEEDMSKLRIQVAERDLEIGKVKEENKKRTAEEESRLEIEALQRQLIEREREIGDLKIKLREKEERLTEMNTEQSHGEILGTEQRKVQTLAESREKIQKEYEKLQ